MKSKIIITAVLALCGFSQYSHSSEQTPIQHYKQEYDAALKGQGWYDKMYIPTQEEVEGVHGNSEHIKIRLPLDLQRILSEYRENGKPISIAVSCGDRELPWREYLTGTLGRDDVNSNDDHSDPTLQFSSSPIDHKKNKENFISIDPILGISPDMVEIGGSGRGAGHIVMDATNFDHWKQLAEFLKQNNIKVHQIIFTAGMGGPAVNLELNPELVKTQLSMLESSGKLIEPYFFHYNPKYDKEYDSVSDLIRPDNSQVWDLGGRSVITSLFWDVDDRFRYKGQRFPTTARIFLEFVEKYNEGKDISTELRDFISKKNPESSEAYKRLLFNLASYIISIVDIDKIVEVGKIYETQYLKQTTSEQMKAIIPFYKEYYRSKGFDVQFITNSKVAAALNSPDIEAQKWQPGDYPYGERDYIAFVLTRKGNS